MTTSRKGASPDLLQRPVNVCIKGGLFKEHFESAKQEKYLLCV